MWFPCWEFRWDTLKLRQSRPHIHCQQRGQQHPCSSPPCPLALHSVRVSCVFFFVLPSTPPSTSKNNASHQTGPVSDRNLKLSFPPPWGACGPFLPTPTKRTFASGAERIRFLRQHRGERKPAKRERRVPIIGTESKPHQLPYNNIDPRGSFNRIPAVPTSSSQSKHNSYSSQKNSPWLPSSHCTRRKHTLLPSKLRYLPQPRAALHTKAWTIPRIRLRLRLTLPQRKITRLDRTAPTGGR
jgi:hypothetical protein